MNNRTATEASRRMQVAAADGVDRAALNARLAEVQSAVRAEKFDEVAAEFDRVYGI